MIIPRVLADLCPEFFMDSIKEIEVNIDSIDYKEEENKETWGR